MDQTAGLKMKMEKPGGVRAGRRGRRISIGGMVPFLSISLLAMILGYQKGFEKEILQLVEDVDGQCGRRCLGVCGWEP